MAKAWRHCKLQCGQKRMLAQFISSRQTTGKVQRCRWPKTSQSYCCEFSLNVLWWRLIAEKGKYSCKLLKYHLNSMHLRDIFALQKYQLLIVKKQHNIQYQWAKRPWIPDESWLQVSRRRNKQLYTFLSCKFISQLSWSNYFRLFGNGQNVHFLSLALYPIYCPQSFSGGGLYSKQNGLLFWSVIGDCDYGVCGECNAFDLVTFRKLGWIL